MAEITPDDVREFLRSIEGDIITVDSLRHELNVMPGTKSFDKIRDIRDKDLDSTPLSFVHQGSDDKKYSNMVIIYKQEYDWLRLLSVFYH